MSICVKRDRETVSGLTFVLLCMGKGEGASLWLKEDDESWKSCSFIYLFLTDCFLYATNKSAFWSCQFLTLTGTNSPGKNIANTYFTPRLQPSPKYLGLFLFLVCLGAPQCHFSLTHTLTQLLIHYLFTSSIQQQHTVCLVEDNHVLLFILLK